MACEACKVSRSRCSLAPSDPSGGITASSVGPALSSLAESFAAEGPIQISSDVLTTRVVELGAAMSGACHTIAEATCHSDLIQLAALRHRFPGIPLPPMAEEEEVAQLRRMEGTEMWWRSVIPRALSAGPLSSGRIHPQRLWAPGDQDVNSSAWGRFFPPNGRRAPPEATEGDPPRAVKRMRTAEPTREPEGPEGCQRESSGSTGAPVEASEEGKEETNRRGSEAKVESGEREREGSGKE